ncbi:MAG: phage tail terminator-like protein [Candidatus Humimicrobiaceae bacterium]
MTVTEVRNIIMSRYLTEYTGQFTIAIDNQIANAPDDEEWVRLTVNFNDGFQDSLGTAGNRKYLKSGMIFIQVFFPMNKGTDNSDTLAEDSANLFDGFRIQDLWMFNGRVKTIGSDGEFYQQNAVIDFEYENVR